MTVSEKNHLVDRYKELVNDYAELNREMQTVYADQERLFIKMFSIMDDVFLRVLNDRNGTPSSGRL